MVIIPAHLHAETVHTILLVQASTNANSRKWSEHETVAAAMQSVIDAFQFQLKQRHRNAVNISYDIQELYDYVDKHYELAALVFDPVTKAYSPHEKAWIKQRLHSQLVKAQR